MEEISQLWNQKMFKWFREKFPNAHYFMVVLGFKQLNIIERNRQTIDVS
jgi:hypothetical protein